MEALTKHSQSTNKNIDWSVAKDLYLQGVSPREIAKRLDTTSGTVRQRASKEKWRDKRASIITHVEEKILTHHETTLEAMRKKKIEAGDSLILAGLGTLAQYGIDNAHAAVKAVRIGFDLHQEGLIGNEKEQSAGGGIINVLINVPRPPNE